MTRKNKLDGALLSADNPSRMPSKMVYPTDVILSKFNSQFLQGVYGHDDATIEALGFELRWCGLDAEYFLSEAEHQASWPQPFPAGWLQPSFRVG